MYRCNMNVYLVRHTAVDVPRGMCYGQTDVPLKETFPQEAAAVAGRLDAVLPDRSILDTVYTSPLSRATRLAEFCGYGDAVRESRIMEINFGEWEGQDYNTIQDPRLQEWFEDYLHVRATGGESFEDQFNRVAEFLKEQKLSGKRNILCFCHGGVLICAKILSGLLKPEEAFSSLDDYGSVIKVEIH